MEIQHSGSYVLVSHTIYLIIEWASYRPFLIGLLYYKALPIAH